MVIDRNTNNSGPDVGGAGSIAAGPRETRSGERVDAGFAELMGAMSIMAGPEVAIPRGEEGLEKQMFEATPADARSRRLAESREEIEAGAVRDPRAVRFDRAGDSGGDRSRAGGTSSPLPNHASVVTGNNSSNGASDSPALIDARGNLQAAGLSMERSHSGAIGLGSRGSSDLNGIQEVLAHNTGASAAALVSTQGTSAPVASAGSLSSTPSARLMGIQSPAQQVGQLLQSGLGGESESARSVAGVDSRSEARGSGQRGTQPHHEGRLSTKSNEDSGSVRVNQGGRAAEPTPFDQMVRSMRMRASERMSSARMQLDPPELGRMRVDVRVVEGRAEIQVRTETPEAAYRLYDRAVELRAALEQHGLRVDRFDVEVETTDFDDLSRGTEGSGYGGVRQELGGSDQTGLRWGGGLEDEADASAWFEPDLAELWNSGRWINVSERRVDVRV